MRRRRCAGQRQPHPPPPRCEQDALWPTPPVPHLRPAVPTLSATSTPGQLPPSSPPTMEATASTFLSARPTPSSLPRPSLRRSRVRVLAAARRRPLSAAAASTSNYVVPLDAAPSGITRPLVEILRDLNKRVPDTIVLPASRRASASDPVVPWYHANRMLSFYAPAWHDRVVADGAARCCCCRPLQRRSRFLFDALLLRPIPPSSHQGVCADASHLVAAACADLQDGELVHAENFSLFAAMSA